MGEGEDSSSWPGKVETLYEGLNNIQQGVKKADLTVNRLHII